jgi:hypothetical protein
MKDASRQDKQMPNGMIEIVVSHKEGNASSIADASQNKKVDTSLGKAFHHFWHTHQTRPTHTQIHGQGKLHTIPPRRQESFDTNSTKAANPNKAQQTDGPNGFVAENDLQKGCVTTRYKDVNG